MSEAEFEENKSGLISQLLQADKNLASRSQRYWQDLDLGFLQFDSRKQLAGQIQAISKKAFLPFFDDLVNRLEEHRLVIYSRGKFDDLPMGKPIESIRQFKEGDTLSIDSGVASVAASAG